MHYYWYLSFLLTHHVQHSTVYLPFNIFLVFSGAPFLWFRRLNCRPCILVFWMRFHFRWSCNLLDQAVPFPMMSPCPIIFKSSRVKMSLLLNDVTSVFGKQSGKKRAGQTEEHRKWEERLFCSGPAWQLREIRKHTLGSSILAALMQFILILFRVMVKGEGASLYCSVCMSTAASKDLSLIWSVPKVLNPPFQNGSLVSKIIWNT